MKDYLTIACSADWHIGDHSQFSIIDETGRPSRLVQYERLARDFHAFAKRNNADLIVIAGDLVDQAVMKPMVLDTLDYVLTTLSDGRSLIITHGQHDIDTKSENIASYHSALCLYRDGYENLFYYDNEGNIECDGFKVWVQPWSAAHKVNQVASGDLFISHGSVQRCTNYEGYQFNSGFDQEDLLSKFRLSIIGDIHNGQTFRSKSGLRKILIPGSPIQFDYKDSPITGFWLCKIPKENAPIETTFTPIESISPDTYHRFLFTKDPEQKSISLVHYRYRADKHEGVQSKTTSEFRERTSSLLDVGRRIILESKIDNHELCTDIFTKLFDSSRNRSRKVPKTTLLSLRIKNFLSVGEFELSFKEFPDNLVITGENGHGKTSIMEAIFWCCSGSTTKGVTANGVINRYGDGTGTKVELLIDIEGTIYKIVRTRESGKPGLAIYIWEP